MSARELEQACLFSASGEKKLPYDRQKNDRMAAFLNQRMVINMA